MCVFVCVCLCVCLCYLSCSKRTAKTDADGNTRCLISHKTELLAWRRLHQSRHPLHLPALPPFKPVKGGRGAAVPQVGNMSKASLGFSSARAEMKLDVCQAAFPFAAPLPSPPRSLHYPLATFSVPPLALATSARCSVVAVAALCAPVARFEFGALIYVNAPCSFAAPSQLPPLSGSCGYSLPAFAI